MIVQRRPGVYGPGIMRLLFKIIAAGAWASAVRAGRFEGAAIDLRDGFIHLSAGHQLRETAARHFAGQKGLVLVAFAEDQLANLKWEPSRGGKLVFGKRHQHQAVAASKMPRRGFTHLVASRQMNEAIHEVDCRPLEAPSAGRAGPRPGFNDLVQESHGKPP